MTNKPRRPWFRFSLRTLLVIVAILAIGAAWAGKQLQWIYARHQYIRNFATERRQDPPAPWPLYLFLEGGVGRLMLIDEATDADMQEALRLFPELATIDVRGVTYAPDNGEWIEFKEWYK